MSSAQNLFISGDVHFCTVGKMAADEYNDSDQFSDDDVYDNLGENDFDLFELTEEERAEHLKMIVRVVMNWMMKTCHCFLLAQPRFEWTGWDTAVTRDIPLMSSADVYIDIVNIVVQSYGANIVHIYMIEMVHG